LLFSKSNGNAPALAPIAALAQESFPPTESGGERARTSSFTQVSAGQAKRSAQFCDAWQSEVSEVRSFPRWQEIDTFKIGAIVAP
jgi:hypothetical protein